MVANRWESQSPRDQPDIVALRKRLATLIAQERSLVFFHFDGDLSWSKRSGFQRRDRFKDGIVDKVRLILEGAGNLPLRSKDQVDQCLARLMTVVPFYSIEAWVFHHREKMLEVCRRHCGAKHGQHAHSCGEWLNAPAQLEELEQIKERWCLRDGYNFHLVSDPSFPWAQLRRVGKSYSAFVNELGANSEAVRVLAMTAAERTAGDGTR